MQVFNLIYTKVASPEESPWQKAGSPPLDAHTLFYPIDIMTKEDVLKLEKRIQFPDPRSRKLDRKITVFYQEIQGKYHLVILHICNLPDARDVYGRDGIFLCHGFIFPPELWRNVPTPLILFNLVKDSLFTSREEVLSSPKVDRKTGNILPIEISQESLKSLSKSIPQLTDEFELKMVILLNRIANTKGRKINILLKGEPNHISSVMDKIAAYIPNDLKVNVGWDPAFDGGNLEFYPLNIVGFKNDRPMGGNPLNIDIGTHTIQENSNVSQYFMLNTLYENWLSQCRSEAISQENIEKAYGLSLMLEAETNPTGGEILPKMPCFASANKSLIENLFFKRCEKILGATITQHVAGVLDVGLKFDLLIENLPIAKLSEHVEDVIWNRLIPKSIKVPLPDSLIDAGSYKLKLIAKLWKGEVLVKKDLEPIDKKEKIEFVEHLLLTGYAEKDWLLDILREDEEMFKHLISTNETQKLIERTLLDIIYRKKDFKGIEKLILSQVKEQKKEFSLFKDRINLMEILEEFLKKGSWDKNEIKDIYSWAKKTSPPVEGFPYIKAFLYPKQGISKIVLKDDRIKGILLRYLIEYHKYNDDGFEKLGINIKEYLESIERKQKTALVEYLLSIGWEEKDWLQDILKEDEEMFEHLLSTNETHKLMERNLLDIISRKKDFKGIEKFILSQVKEKKKEFSLFRDRIILMEVLEEFLKKGLWDENEIKDIYSWAKKTSPPTGDFPYIKAFLYPKQGISESVLKDGKIKEKLLRSLIEYHKYSDDELERLGFKIKKVPRDKGLIDKVLSRFKL